MAQGELKAGQPEVAAKKAVLSKPSGQATEPVGDDEVSTRRPTSFTRFLRDVFIITALLGGGLFFYRKHTVTKTEVAELATKAADKLEKDDLESLKQAEAIYKQILDLDKNNDKGLVGLAEVYFYESQHGLPTRPQAEQYARQASGSDSADLIALNAYMKITSGGAQSAESELKSALDMGMGSSKLGHALGWAYLEQGNYAQANQVVRAALDGDFNAVRFALTLAEVAHRQGEDRAAIRQLRNATQSGLNPNHELALAWLAALSAKSYGNVAAPAKAIQDVSARKDKIGPRTAAYLVWAEGELALAVGNAGGAVEKADAALGMIKDFPPFLELKARALLAQKKNGEAIELLQKAVKLPPEYRGIKLALVKLLSDRKDDAALALIDELQKSAGGTPGPEFELLRGEHYLAKGDTESAKAAFTKAAELGDDPAILFGLARVAFLEEKKKDKKADLERVAQAFGDTLERRSTYPEVHDYMAEIALWNFDVGGANNSFTEAEAQYKKLNRPVLAMVQFYDRVIQSFDNLKDKASKAEGAKMSGAWKKKKDEYLASVVSSGGQQAPE